jgi:hypothetical protein
MAKWIELLKPGAWKDRTGKVVEITKETIRRIHDNYKSETPAHILVGHPDKAKVPSFGIIESLKMAGDVLLCRPGSVVAEFAALVGKGAFPGVSAGLSADCSRLDHVAFLSAERPAIDGLKPVLEFSAQPESSIVSVDITSGFNRTEFASASVDWIKWRIKDIGMLLRNVKNYLIEKDGQEKADKLLDEWRVTELQSDPPDEPVNQFSQSPQGGAMDFEKLYNELKAAVDGILAKFKAPGMTEFSAHVDGVVAENATLKTDNAALKTQVEMFRTEKRGLEFSAFVETLITGRRVKPDEKTAIVAKLEAMHLATPVEFSAASGAKSPLDIYKEELQARPVTVPPTGEETHGVEFSASGASGDEIAEQMTRYIDEQAAKGVKIDVFAARKHVIGR